MATPLSTSAVATSAAGTTTTMTTTATNATATRLYHGCTGAAGVCGAPYTLPLWSRSRWKLHAVSVSSDYMYRI
ncbi:hypothetical protein PR003_g32868, partial [Phytophthora rubi]